MEENKEELSHIDKNGKVITKKEMREENKKICDGLLAIINKSERKKEPEPTIPLSEFDNILTWAKNNGWEYLGNSEWRKHVNPSGVLFKKTSELFVLTLYKEGK